MFFWVVPCTKTSDIGAKIRREWEKITASLGKKQSKPGVKPMALAVGQWCH